MYIEPFSSLSLLSESASHVVHTHTRAGGGGASSGSWEAPLVLSLLALLVQKYKY